MKKIMVLFVCVIALGVISPGCKKSVYEEAAEIAEAYYTAILEGQVDESYGYLCDKSYVLATPDGQEVRFAARPELETYRSVITRAARIAIATIEPRADLSSQDEVLVFEITARTHADPTLQRFLAYMGRNSKGKWSILLPVPSQAQPVEPAPDSEETHLHQ